ncbi:MAG: hypothetical protein WD942_06195 [Dehalococcoidia bacterium]
MRLAVVVPCTDSKSGNGGLVALRDLNRTLPVSEIAKRWVDQLSAAPPHSLARDLYKGPGWTASLNLVVALQDTEAEVDWRILSAGYGLLRPDEQTTRYSATFLAGKPDSVPGGDLEAEAASRWWSKVNCLRDQAEPLLRLAYGMDGLIVAASAPYVDALSPEILAASSTVPTVVFCTGRPRVSEVSALAPHFDRRLREGDEPFVRGGDLGFNQRVATRLVEELGTAITDRSRVDEVLAAAMDREGPVRHGRRVASDATVMAFIESALTRDPSASRTALLRRWRDAGRACEQRRFGDLYQRVVAERSGQMAFGEAVHG